VLAAASGLFSIEEISASTRARLGKKLSSALVEANIRAITRAASEFQEG
jgi:Pyruvate/2-oxoacid:ferredoxin oxidoreductase gamma subunit